MSNKNLDKSDIKKTEEHHSGLTTSIREKLNFTNDSLWRKFSARRLELIDSLSLSDKKASEQDFEIASVARSLCSEFKYPEENQNDFDKLVRAAIQSARRNRKRLPKARAIRHQKYHHQQQQHQQQLQQQLRQHHDERILNQNSQIHVNLSQSQTKVKDENSFHNVQIQNQNQQQIQIQNQNQSSMADKVRRMKNFSSQSCSTSGEAKPVPVEMGFFKNSSHFYSSSPSPTSTSSCSPPIKRRRSIPAHIDDDLHSYKSVVQQSPLINVINDTNSLSTIKFPSFFSKNLEDSPKSPDDYSLSFTSSGFGIGILEVYFNANLIYNGKKVNQSSLSNFALFVLSILFSQSLILPNASYNDISFFRINRDGSRNEITSETAFSAALRPFIARVEATISPNAIATFPTQVSFNPSSFSIDTMFNNTDDLKRNPRCSISSPNKPYYSSISSVSSSTSTSSFSSLSPTVSGNSINSLNPPSLCYPSFSSSSSLPYQSNHTLPNTIIEENALPSISTLRLNSISSPAIKSSPSTPTSFPSLSPCTSSTSFLNTNQNSSKFPAPLVNSQLTNPAPSASSSTGLALTDFSTSDSLSISVNNASYESITKYFLIMQDSIPASSALPFLSYAQLLYNHKRNYFSIDNNETKINSADFTNGCSFYSVLQDESIPRISSFSSTAQEGVLGKSVAVSAVFYTLDKFFSHLTRSKLNSIADLLVSKAALIMVARLVNISSFFSDCSYDSTSGTVIDETNTINNTDESLNQPSSYDNKSSQTENNEDILALQLQMTIGQCVKNYGFDVIVHALGSLYKEMVIFELSHEEHRAAELPDPNNFLTSSPLLESSSTGMYIDQTQKDLTTSVKVVYYDAEIQKYVNSFVNISQTTSFESLLAKVKSMFGISFDNIVELFTGEKFDTKLSTDLDVHNIFLSNMQSHFSADSKMEVNTQSSFSEVVISVVVNSHQQDDNQNRNHYGNSIENDALSVKSEKNRVSPAEITPTRVNGIIGQPIS